MSRWPRLLVAGALHGLALCASGATLTLRSEYQLQEAGLNAPLLKIDNSRTTHSALLRWQAEAPFQATLSGAWSAQRANDGSAALRVNQLILDRSVGAGYLSAGKKVVSWDVGYAFRPLDIVQQEDRRTLHAGQLEGVPMLAWEVFDAQRALTLVLSRPRMAKRGQARRAPELAARWYRRNGARDEFVVLGWSEGSGARAGFGVAQVEGDALELHGSLLWQQRHQKRLVQLAPAALAQHDPASWQRVDGGARLMAGLSWNSASKLSVLAEAWLDRTAYGRREWNAWHARNAALVALATPGAAAAALARANLGWNASSLQGVSLRQKNVMLRLAQVAGAFEASADVVWMPEDDGVIASTGLVWKDGPWQFKASWRQFGGARKSAARALPLRSVALATLERTF